ncbi:divalent metal transporter 1 [Fragilariopsis cylindrus CCMP1102]|nr:divalent metal transporter 1 [Fragilariopsis cylindrus CCMP1102]|eukprot:OEU07963.1 divalent metal transporter 1 [Fragilariopsis cylindrus CCMP1102]
MSSGSKWRDYLHFCGPGWLVAIAYLDPGNTQADIQAGAVGGYSQLWTFFWVTTLSIYVQVLCARLSMVGQTTLSESMRKIIKHRWLRYVAWAIAEFSVIITDIPEVIGMGIAFNVFFGWPYYVGCLISPVTTLLFLATQNSKGGMRWLEGVIVLLIGVMAVTIFIEWGLVDSDPAKAIEGLVYGFVEPEGRNLWLITGIIGAVVMPHNLYLHTASVLSRPVKRDNETIKKATFWVSVEPIVPIMFSFLINIGIVIVAAENVNGKCIPVGGESEEDCENNIGNTDFAKYLTVAGGPILWGIALLAAGQSSAITTTYSGQYIMDGFLEMRIPVWARAIGTRMIALLPCVLIAACVPR